MATAFKTQFTKDIRDNIEHAQQFDAYFADIDVEEALNESVNYGSVYAETDIVCPNCSDDEDIISMQTVRNGSILEDVCPLCNYTVENYSHTFDW